MPLSFTRTLIAPLLTFTFIPLLAQDNGAKPTAIDVLCRLAQELRDLWIFQWEVAEATEA